ncbi:olfactory receptor 1C1-like [Rhinophrynus dorsalis]
MYVFLSNLSLLDICYTSTILPKLLYMLLTQHKTISFTRCMIQMYFFMSFACTEFVLLAVMAYDRFVAICHPLHYVLLMSLKHCTQFATAVWITGLLDPIGHTVCIAHLSFCSSHNIEHFFCDVTPLLKLTCSDTSRIELLTYIDGTFLSLSAFTLTLVSYVLIICTVLKIRSAKGRHKAFSTCASHLSSVVIFYGTFICLYFFLPISPHYPGTHGPSASSQRDPERNDMNLVSLLIASQDMAEQRTVSCGDISVTLKSLDPRLSHVLTLTEFVLACGA